MRDEDVVGGLGVELGPGIIELERLQAMLDAEKARRLIRFDESVEWSVDGSPSAASWIAKRTCGNRAEVAHRVHVARMVAEFDLTRLAWECGKITSQHVSVIAKTRSSARADEQFREFEGEIVTLAMKACPKQVAVQAREWRDALDDLLGRDGAGKPVPDEYEKSEAQYSRTIFGIGVLDARFDAESAEVIGTALARAYEKGHREGDPRSPSLQRADAIITIFRSYLNAQPASGNRPHIGIVADLNTILGDTTGGCHTQSGFPLTADAVRRVMCNADINLVLTDGLVPLAMGRTVRIFTPHQYRAMIIRDGGCRMCGAPPAQCEAHHKDEWVKQRGPTDMSNGFLVSRGHCHRLLHEKKWTVTGDANTTLNFHDPNRIIQHTSDPKIPDIRRHTRHARQRQKECDQIIKRLDEYRADIDKHNRNTPEQRTKRASPPPSRQ